MPETGSCSTLVPLPSSALGQTVRGLVMTEDRGSAFGKLRKIATIERSAPLPPPDRLPAFNVQQLESLIETAGAEGAMKAVWHEEARLLTARLDRLDEQIRDHGYSIEAERHYHKQDRPVEPNGALTKLFGIGKAKFEREQAIWRMSGKEIDEREDLLGRRLIFLESYRADGPGSSREKFLAQKVENHHHYAALNERCLAIAEDQWEVQILNDDEPSYEIVENTNALDRAVFHAALAGVLGDHFDQQASQSTAELPVHADDAHDLPVQLNADGRAGYITDLAGVIAGQVERAAAEPTNGQQAAPQRQQTPRARR